MEDSIRFRVTAEEKDAFEQEAQKLGISVTSFIKLLFKQWANGIRFEKKSTNSIEKSSPALISKGSPPVKLEGD